MTIEQDQYPRSGNHTLRRTLCIVLAIIILLFILTSIVLASRLSELAGRSERPVLLEVGENSRIDIFKIEYENGDGFVTVRGAKSRKLVAPGTENVAFIYYANADTTAIDYTMEPSASFHDEELHIPIQVRLIAPDGNYIIGSSTSWEPVENLNSIPAAVNTIGKGKEVVYTLEWRWDFRSDNPEDIAYDTLLGDAAAAGHDVGLEISFTTVATANTEVDANGGFISSGMLGNVLYGILWILLLIALALVIVAIVKGRKKNDDPDDTPDSDPTDTPID